MLSQLLSGLDILVDQRQSPWVFVKIALLAMPQLIVMILPVAVLVATLVAMNRLHTEQEIVICFSGGMSRWRVIAPAVELAAWLTVISLVLTLWIQPLSYRALRQSLEAVRGDLVASMVKPGHFSHPAPGLTVYAQSVDDDGAIHNLFIDRDNAKGQDTTITAREGRLERRAGGPVLVLRQGANQEFTSQGVLNYLSFDEYVFDLRPLIGLGRQTRYKLSDRYLHELFFPDLRASWERRGLFTPRRAALQCRLPVHGHGGGDRGGLQPAGLRAAHGRGGRRGSGGPHRRLRGSGGGGRRTSLQLSAIRDSPGRDGHRGFGAV